MKILLKTTTDRVTAMFLFILFMEISVSLVLGISCMYDYHFYASDYKTYATQAAFGVKSEAEIDNIASYAVLYRKQQSGAELTAQERSELSLYEKRYVPGMTNARFEVYADGGVQPLLRFMPQDGGTEGFTFRRFAERTVYDENGTPTDLSVRFFLMPELTAKDSFRLVAELVRIAVMIRYPIVVMLVLTVILALLILGALMSSVEVTDANGNFKRENFIDRIPLDLLILMLLFVFGFFGVLVALTAVADVKSTNIVLWNAVILIISFFLIVVAMVFNLSLASRVKRGHVYRNTLVFRVIARIRKMAGKENDGYFKVPFIGKALLTVGLAVLAELIVLLFFLYSYYTNESGLLHDFKFIYYVCFWAAGRFILIPVFFMMALNLSRIRENGARLAEGDYAFDADSQIMFGDFRQINANLTKIREDMMDAAEEKNRSYQMRSELITNISHDIKTPLTSIVNYVDLLKRTGTDDETAAEYMEILQTQSVKLKKLLENLIEVSKLTAGDISVQMDSLDVVTFVEQTVSEFADRLEAAQLEFVTAFAAPEMQIFADGDKLWRVFENLIGNILKYAQTGTRVYLDVAWEGRDRVRITFKNVSRDPIHVSGEELTRRFARADASRHSEGYGLGLSIAQSLTQIQGGTFDVTVDGDLFRVDMTFQKAEG